MTPDEIREMVGRIQSDVATSAAQELEAAAKPWWQSRTIWGAVVVLAAQLLRLAEIEVDVDGMTDAALSLATLFGAVMAWWGRLQAQQPVSRTKVIPGVEITKGREL